MNRERFLEQLEINSKHVNSQIAEFTSAFISVPKSTEDLFGSAIFKKRTELTPLHFGLLLFSAYQYALIKHVDKAVLEDMKTWNDAFAVLPQEESVSTILNCLAEKHVNITNPYRYGSLVVGIEKLFGDRDVNNVLDIGCGFYPNGIAALSNGFLPEPEDDDSLKLISKTKAHKFSPGKILAIDIQPPDPEWAAACVWQPISELPSTTRKFQEMLREAESNVQFILGDMADSELNLGNEIVEVCFAANIVYQLSENQRPNFLRNIVSVLQPKGWAIFMEYKEGGSRRRPFTYVATARQKLSPNSLGEPIELFALNSADCTQMKIRS